MSMEERRWMLAASGVCWWFCLMTYFVQLDLFDGFANKQQDNIVVWSFYFVIGFGSLGYLYASWFIATKLVLPGIPFLLGKTLVPPPFWNPNHPDYLGVDLEDDDDGDPLFNAAMTFLALKLATRILTFSAMIDSSKVYLCGFRIAQLMCVLSPFFVLNVLVGGVRDSDFGPVVLAVGFVSLMGEGHLLIFGLECFKSFYGLLVAALAGVVLTTSSRNNNTVATLIVCLMSALITCLCGVCLFLLSRIHNTGASAAAADAPPPSQASPPPPPPIESAV